MLTSFNPPAVGAGPNKRGDSGFTLVEVAMVLMIVGLMLGSIVKGQELINSAKTKGLAQDFLAVQTALYSYQVRFRSLPGDDRTASKSDPRAIIATTPSGMIANGRIDGAWDSTTDTDESRLFWQHVRLAGYLAGPIALTDPDFSPHTQFGTKMGISSTMLLTGGGAVPGVHHICAGGIPGKTAKHLDMHIDDGNTLTGSLRTGNETAPHNVLAAAAIDDDGKYLVCLAF